MKILFSADWHLGYELGGANRQRRLPDQARQLRLIARYCQEHAVDVLAVAGDVFEAQDRTAARQAVAEMVGALRAPLDRGMRLLAIAGNHDRDWFMETANIWLATEAAAGDERVIFRTKPDLVTIEANGEPVNFAMMPFPTESRYSMPRDTEGGAARMRQLIAQRFADAMEEIRKRAEEQNLPTVMLAHVTVEGTTVRAHRIAPRDDVVIPFALFPQFELTVIGHIHKGEQIGAGPVYYVGALDRMDLGEREYQPRVLLADIGAGGVRSVQSLPLDPTPFAEIVATTLEELDAAAAAIPDLPATLVKVRLMVEPAEFVGPLIHRAGELFPRLYGNVEVERRAEERAPIAIDGANTADVLGTVRRYLESQSQVREDELEPLMAIVGELRAATAEDDQ